MLSDGAKAAETCGSAARYDLAEWTKDAKPPGKRRRSKASIP